MAKTNPWHLMSAWVYHNNTHCDVGRAIPDRQRTPGTGSKRRCDECSRLNRQEDDTRRHKG